MLSDSDRRTAQELEAALLSDPAFRRAALPVADALRRSCAPVVVGVPAHGGTSPALEWAAAEAAGRRRPLRIVHAFPSPVPIDPLGVVPAVDDPTAQQAAAQFVDDAAARARSIAPGVEVSAAVVRGAPRRVLLHESRDASLLVLGARRRAGQRPSVRRALHGSLALRMTATAGCPVAVVHPSGDVAPGPGTPRVVVGIDGLAHTDPAVGFAFEAASRRGTALTAVHAWWADCPADLEAVTAPLVTSEAVAYALVDGAVAAWRERYPDVPVTPEVVRRDPASALITGSAGAALVVVGSRGRRAGLGAVFGSVSRAVVDGAAVPVAVVRRGTEPFAAGADRWARG